MLVCVAASLYVIVIIVFMTFFLSPATMIVTIVACEQPTDPCRLLMAISALGRRQATQLQLLCTSKL